VRRARVRFDSFRSLLEWDKSTEVFFCLLKRPHNKHKLNDDFVVCTRYVPSSPLRKMARRFTLMSTFLA
jgi:hypothetical protein